MASICAQLYAPVSSCSSRNILQNRWTRVTLSRDADDDVL